MGKAQSPGPWRRVPQPYVPRQRQKRPKQGKGKRPLIDERRVISGQTVWADYYSNSSQNSPRVNGKLVLRDNAHDYRKLSLIKWENYPDDTGSRSNFATTRRGLNPPTEWATLQNAAYAKLRGKLYKNSASLGVTFAQYGQASSMIIHRLRTVQALLDLTIRKVTANRRHREAIRRIQNDNIRGGRETAANIVLETNFGWAPLVSDIRNSFLQLAGDHPKAQFVKGKASCPVLKKTSGKDTYRTSWFEDWEGVARCTMSATVTVSNPNIWMLNKLGLLNPVAVAWDAVPWSFVVNMFVNVNSLINSLTDFMGLSFGSVNMTRSALITHTYTETNIRGFSPYTTRVDLYTYRIRTLHSTPPRPTLQFRAPEMNKDLLIIAGGLVVQRFKKLNNLLGFPPIY